jgi:hypothetical protein
MCRVEQSRTERCKAEQASAERNRGSSVREALGERWSLETKNKESRNCTQQGSSHVLKSQHYRLKPSRKSAGHLVKV